MPAYLGTESGETITGSTSSDMIYGYGGDDHLLGSTGNDNLFGGTGNDTVWGGYGTDWCYGEDGNDTLTGGGDASSDYLYGGAGTDSLSGDGGNDVLQGDAGADTLTGGAGADDFDYRLIADSNTAGGIDRIADFSQGADKIKLMYIDANTYTSGNQAFTFVGSSNFSGQAGELRYAQDSGAGLTRIEADVNGDGAADMQIQLVGVIPLTASDFYL